MAESESLLQEMTNHIPPPLPQNKTSGGPTPKPQPDWGEDLPKLGPGNQLGMVLVGWGLVENFKNNCMYNVSMEKVVLE
jgi:hypothetical protein